MSPRKPPEPEEAGREPGRGSIPARIAERLRRRAQAFAEATSRPHGKPWDGATYGRREEPSPKMHADRAKAIREHDAKQPERD